MKEIFNRFLGTRFGMATLLAVGSALFCAIFTAVICAIGGDFGKFKPTFEACFLLFGAGGVVGAILCIVTTLPTDYVMGFGNGIYYGTAVSAGLVKKLWPAIEFDATLFLCTIIVLLVSYILWIKVYSK